MEYKDEKQVCQNCKKDFTIESEDFNFYERVKVPAPTWCPECREIRRCTFRNERSLYKRKCDLCENLVVSRVSPNKKYPMYCQKCWWSDGWDSYKYGKDYDFSKPFFEQLKELLFSVPHISIQNSNSINSEWVNQETDDKNCYLNVGGHYNEDSAYNTYELYGKNCFDSFWLIKSENCSFCINCEDSFNLHFSQDTRDSMDCYFMLDCRNCSNCIGCAGLRNQKFCIFNKQHTEEEYYDFLKKNPLSSYSFFSKVREESYEVWLKFPRKNLFIENSNNVTGNCIKNSKNSHEIFYATKVEDVKYSYVVGWSRDCMDTTSLGASEISYEAASGGGVYNSKFVSGCMASDPMKKIHAYNLEFCFMVVSSSNCFGCVGLRNAEYCILNKKYSKEEYEKLVLKIKEDMNKNPYIDKNGRVYKYGEFFPIDLSPFGYNETVAIDYYPLKREDALRKGYPWEDFHQDVKYEFSDYKIPDSIHDVRDDVLEKVLKCEKTGKAYKIINKELNFYRKVGLPLPRICPSERYSDRISKLLPRKLFSRTCDKCGKDIMTSYPLARIEMVYCEQCYNKEVY